MGCQPPDLQGGNMMLMTGQHGGCYWDLCVDRTSATIMTCNTKLMAKSFYTNFYFQGWYSTVFVVYKILSLFISFSLSTMFTCYKIWQPCFIFTKSHIISRHFLFCCSLGYIPWNVLPWQNGFARETLSFGCNQESCKMFQDSLHAVCLFLWGLRLYVVGLKASWLWVICYLWWPVTELISLIYGGK